MHDHNYKKYVYVMKKNYNKNKLNKEFTIGSKVMYYVGDRAHTSKKLRPRYTGPFIVVDMIGRNAARILNEDTDETMVCHVKMLKLYNEQYFTPLKIYERTIKQKQKLDKQMKQQPLNKDAHKQQKKRKKRKKKKDITNETSDDSDVTLVTDKTPPDKLVEDADDSADYY